MKKPFSRLIPISLLIASLLAVIPIPVYAAPAVTSITPNTIVNDVANEIIVGGTEFDATAIVFLDNMQLATTFKDANTLSASIPVGVSEGSHQITVSMGGTTIQGFANLKVLSPTPVPPTPTTAPLPFTRPQFILESTKVNGTVATNSQFKLQVKIGNAGTAPAYSVQVVFASADLVPLKTGGIAAVGSVGAGDSDMVTQQFLVTGSTYGVAILSLDVTVTYYDSAGTSYSDKFTASLPTSGGSGSGTVYATATPTAIKNSQLVITSYAISVDPLQPGETFTLTMTIQNTGNAPAKSVTMIVGGGSSGTSSGGTPEPGGVSGGSGEFTNFAPVGASNVQTLGDLEAGGAVQASQNLIVNTSTNPGAYPMKVTFSYVNTDNEPINDDQVITLLVYSLPNVDVSFYRPLDPFFVGQPGALPIQVVNIGKRAAILGNIKVETEAGTVENGTGLVGSIDTGGYYTMDAMLTPEKSGKVTLKITIDYTDDFNEARTIEKTQEVEVMEGMSEGPMTDPSMGGAEGGGGGGGGGELPVVTQETSLQKVWRFVLGLLGLDSAAPSGGEQVPPGTEMPIPQVKPGTGKG